MVLHSVLDEIPMMACIVFCLNMRSRLVPRLLLQVSCKGASLILALFFPDDDDDNDDDDDV